MFATNGICFNYESPRRAETFVTRKITKAAARIKLGKQQCLYLGHIEAKRDWSHAKDTVNAMYLINNHHTPDDFVVSSGETHSVREFLEKVFHFHGLNWQDHVKIDPKYYRPSEVDILLGDCSKIKKVLHWKPEYNFDQLVQEMTEQDYILEQKNG